MTAKDELARFLMGSMTEPLSRQERLKVLHILPIDAIVKMAEHDCEQGSMQWLLSAQDAGLLDIDREHEKTKSLDIGYRLMSASFKAFRCFEDMQQNHRPKVRLKLNNDFKQGFSLWVDRLLENSRRLVLKQEPSLASDAKEIQTLPGWHKGFPNPVENPVPGDGQTSSILLTDAWARVLSVACAAGFPDVVQKIARHLPETLRATVTKATVTLDPNDKGSALNLIAQPDQMLTAAGVALEFGQKDCLNVVLKGTPAPWPFALKRDFNRQEEPLDAIDMMDNPLLCDADTFRVALRESFPNLQAKDASAQTIFGRLQSQANDCMNSYFAINNTHLLPVLAETGVFNLDPAASMKLAIEYGHPWMISSIAGPIGWKNVFDELTGDNNPSASPPDLWSSDPALADLSLATAFQRAKDEGAEHHALAFGRATELTQGMTPSLSAIMKAGMSQSLGQLLSMGLDVHAKASAVVNSPLEWADAHEPHMAALMRSFEAKAHVNRILQNGLSISP